MLIISFIRTRWHDPKQQCYLILPISIDVWALPLEVARWPTSVCLLTFTTFDRRRGDSDMGKGHNDRSYPPQIAQAANSNDRTGLDTSFDRQVLSHLRMQITLPARILPRMVSYFIHALMV